MYKKYPYASIFALAAIIVGAGFSVMYGACYLIVAFAK